MVMMNIVFAGLVVWASYTVGHWVGWERGRKNASP
jgi:hypothetical protein